MHDNECVLPLVKARVHGRGIETESEKKGIQELVKQCRALFNSIESETKFQNLVGTFDVGARWVYEDGVVDLRLQESLRDIVLTNVPTQFHGIDMKDADRFDANCWRVSVFVGV